MKRDYKVEIVLSTYNGEKYIKDQIDSLLNQDFNNFTIIIRDDGSTDNTKNVLKEYVNHEKIKIIYGENIGVVNSFFHLLTQTSSDVDYIAFCDQDDFWLSDKVSRAVGILNQHDNSMPLVYCSAYTLVDENLKPFSNSKSNKGIIPSPANAIIENIVTGCTAMINHKCRDLIIESLPQHCIMHDWWLYLVGTHFGKVIYDKESKILYRQHSNNVVGAERSFFKKWIIRLKRFNNQKSERLLLRQSIEFQKIFNEKIIENYEEINRFNCRERNIYHRLRYIVTTNLFRQNKIDNLIFKILILLNHI